MNIDLILSVFQTIGIWCIVFLLAKGLFFND